MISSWFIRRQGNFLDFFGNGDMVRHLLAKKVDPQRIHAVEQDEERAKRINRFPLVNKYVGQVRDYADIASATKSTFRVAWLDYCGPISRKAMDDTAAVMPLVDMGGMLILTFLAARERACSMHGHEMREAELPIHVFDAADVAGCKFELRFKAFYSGKHAKTPMMVLGFRRMRTECDAVPKACAMPSVLAAEEKDGLRVVGTFGK